MSLTYRQIVAELESRGMMPDRPLTLEPMHQALDRIGFYTSPFWERLKRDPDRCIIVAGTNGKGSVCSTLETLLTAAGERVGLYTSPHLIDTTERIRLGASDVSQELFCKAYDHVQERTRDLELSHFEALTVMALWLFSSGEATPAVDRILLEVGLGGTWDATNAVPHGMAIIAQLGFDHQNLLGASMQEIAANKFGVVHPPSRDFPRAMKVIHHALPEEAQALARETQARTGSQWIPAESFSHEVDTSGRAPRYWLTTRWGRAEVMLSGARGAQNTATALTAFQALGYEPGRFLPALARVRWPGRMERVDIPGAPCPVYLSGDHNPQGVKSLLELLPDYRRRHLHLLVGIGKDKNFEGILSPLFELPDASVYLTETPFRGRSIEDYGESLSAARGAWADPREALSRIFASAQADDLILVTGSLYLVGEIRKEARSRSH